MSLTSRVKQSRRALDRGLSLLFPNHKPDNIDNQPHQAAFEFKLPNPFGGEPLYRAQISLTTTPHAQGETLRLQAHINGCLTLPDAQTGAEALPASNTGGTGLARRGRNAASGLVRYGVSRVPAKLFAPILQRRMQTWIDIRASSAPLAAGAEALIPERVRNMLREVPRAKPGEPRVVGWSGNIDGPHPGVAQFALLQMDQTDLPPELRGKPFNLSVGLASTLVDESK